MDDCIVRICIHPKVFANLCLVSRRHKRPTIDGLSDGVSFLFSVIHAFRIRLVKQPGVCRDSSRCANRLAVLG